MYTFDSTNINQVSSHKASLINLSTSQLSCTGYTDDIMFLIPIRQHRFAIYTSTSRSSLLTSTIQDIHPSFCISSKSHTANVLLHKETLFGWIVWWQSCIKWIFVSIYHHFSNLHFSHLVLSMYIICSSTLVKFVAIQQWSQDQKTAFWFSLIISFYPFL